MTHLVRHEYDGPEPTVRELADFFTRPWRGSLEISDPTVRKRMSNGDGGAFPATEDRPCLFWTARNEGIHYKVGHDTEWRVLRWSVLATIDNQPDLFEGMGL